MIVKSINLVVGVSAFLWLTSCALKPVTNDYNLVETNINEVDLDDLGNGKVLVYNGAALWIHGRFEKSNVWIDGKGLGQLRVREYVVVDLEEGDYQIRIKRNDGLFTLPKSTHDIKVDKHTRVIKVTPSFFTSSVVQAEELPRRFEKFAYAKK